MVHTDVPAKEEGEIMTIILLGIWKMAYLWLPVTVLMIGAGIYEHKHYKAEDDRFI